MTVGNDYGARHPAAERRIATVHYGIALPRVLREVGAMIAVGQSLLQHGENADPYPFRCAGE
jgi:hypothetical protein